mgnify:CR=1 FL=1
MNRFEALEALRLKLKREGHAEAPLAELQGTSTGNASPQAEEASPEEAMSPGEYVNYVLKVGVEMKASDVELAEGYPPYLRVYRQMHALTSFPPVEREYLESILTDSQKETLQKERDIDFSYAVPGVGRFRVNMYHDRSGLVAVFRTIPEEIPDFSTLGLPERLLSFSELRSGLILVTGPTGSGKSTTLAAFVKHINQTHPAKIITIEDPVEYLHRPIKARISQRQVGVDVTDFHRGLRAALRQAPDVILVGEMRDRESIEMALTAAETGHLVLSTLHTRSAEETAQRIVDAFSEEARSTVRAQLAATLAVVVVQQLIPRKDGKGLVLAYEILVNNTACKNAIRDGKYHEIKNIIENGQSEGMVSMNQTLAQLVREGAIDPMMAEAHSTDPKDLFRRIGLR